MTHIHRHTHHAMRWTRLFRLGCAAAVAIGIGSMFAAGSHGVGTTPVALAQAPRICGPMDVAFLIDDTGSMFGSIANVTAELGTIIPTIDTASGGDYRLSLVTFKDTITVRQNFAASNAAAVSADIAGLFASGGAGEPEASDEGLDTAVNARTKAAADAVAPAGNHQNIDYTPDWDATRGGDSVTKIAIVVTDARPGGFSDSYDAADVTHAHTVALAAAAKAIKVSAIHVPSPGGAAFDAQIAPIMQDYATTTGGIYVLTAADGTGTGAAITDIIASCGTKEVDWVTGAGQITTGTGKNAYKVSFGGNVGALEDGTLVGQWETNFHNVGVSALAGAKFHSTRVESMASSNDGGDGPGQPPANSNVVAFTVTGRLQLRGDKTEGYALDVCLADRGEPGKSDSILFTLRDPGGAVVWTNESDFPSDGAAADCATRVLAHGNLQIHAGPRP